MPIANVLDLLHKENNKLENMVIFGNVRCAISKPDFLSEGVMLTDGFYALLDVYAVRCNGVDYVSKHENYQVPNHMYYSKGSMVIVLSDKGCIGENIKVYGSTTKGVTIKKQYSKSYKDGVCAFCWVKKGGVWCLKPNKVLPFGVADAKGTILEDCIVSVLNKCTFKLPSEVDVAQEYYGVLNAESLSVEDITGGREYSTDHVDVSKLDMKLVHRLNPVEPPEFLDIIGDEVLEISKKSRDYAYAVLDSIQEGMEEDEDYYGDPVVSVAGDIVSSYIKEIGGRYNLPLNGIKGTKGKEFIEDLFDGFMSVRFNDKSMDEENSGAQLMKKINKARQDVAMNANCLMPEHIGIKIYSDYERYATIVIGSITGVGARDIVSNFNSMNSYNEVPFDVWFWCLIRCPYVCGLMGSGLSVVDCDKIYLSFADGYDEDECMEWRNILMCLEAIKKCSSRSTMIPMKEIESLTSVYPSSGKALCDRNGAPFSKDCLTACSLVAKKDIVMPKSMLDDYSLNIKKYIETLCDMGILDTVNEYVMLSKDMVKEYEIFNSLIKKSTFTNDISDEIIERATEDFENKLGFKLEELQKDGIKLTKYKAGVLSGCAGSGKTTTSDGMVTVFKYSDSGSNLKFAAPSGKAARRLAESVEGDAKTIHSLFGIGVESEPFIKKKTGGYQRENSDGGATVYFLDEMAMANTDLVYNIVRGLNEDDSIYFLGDIKQLQPIGKGSPFKALMQFLPCVELGVSKRAAEKGKINYNVALVNFFSDDFMVEMEEGQDFEIVDCSDAEIPEVVVKKFQESLQSYPEDEIQVVSGYNTDKYTWGTVSLNPMLQNITRNKEDLLFIHNDRKFMKNDRVIHVERNAYEMQRYRKVSGTVFEKVPTFGMANGEMGKIVGVLKSNYVTIEDIGSDYPSDLLSKYEKKKESLRDDSAYADEKIYFVVVEVYDVELKDNVYVFYIANYLEGISNEYYTTTFSGADLKCLDLAYALTTHKMQGSQNAVIIIPVGSKSSPQFMNRNMLNTMITRASKKVILVGSIKGRTSAFTDGRKYSSIDDCKDLLGFLAEGVQNGEEEEE